MLHWIDLLDLVDVVPSTRRGWKRMGWLLLAAGVGSVLYLLWNSAMAVFGRQLASTMADDRSQMMFDILLGIQNDLGLIKREQASQGLRLSSIEDHMRGTITSLYGIQNDVGDLKLRVDRIERRLGLNEAEH